MQAQQTEAGAPVEVAPRILTNNRNGIVPEDGSPLNRPVVLPSSAVRTPARSYADVAASTSGQRGHGAGRTNAQNNNRHERSTPTRRGGKRSKPQKRNAALPAPDRPREQAGGNPRAEGKGGSQPGQARGQHKENNRAAKFDAGRLAREVARYHMTELYRALAEKPFANEEALEKANEWIRAHVAEIDPAAAAVCHTCGEADLLLCQHKVAHDPWADREIEDPAILVAIHRNNYRRLILGGSTLGQVFAWPKFNPRVNTQPALGGFVNSSIPIDELCDDKLFNYIRLNMKTTYVVDGNYNRPVALAHAQVIAHRYLDELRVPMLERLEPIFVNTFQGTIQRAVDSGINEMLLGYRVGHLNWLGKLPFTVAGWLRSQTTVSKILIASSVFIMLFPPSRRRLLLALCRSRLSLWRQLRLAQLAALLTGSRQAFASVVQKMVKSASAHGELITSGLSRAVSQGTAQPW
jgi:hypothetical protein